MSEAQMTEADPKTVKGWIDADEAVIVDVREPGEVAQARINGAVYLPLSAFDPTKVPDPGDKKLVFICAQGIRSVQAGTYLLQQGLIEEAVNLTGGLAAWAEFGLPLETGPQS